MLDTLAQLYEHLCDFEETTIGGRIQTLATQDGRTARTIKTFKGGYPTVIDTSDLPCFIHLPQGNFSQENRSTGMRIIRGTMRLYLYIYLANEQPKALTLYDTFGYAGIVRDMLDTYPNLEVNGTGLSVLHGRTQLASFVPFAPSLRYPINNGQLFAGAQFDLQISIREQRC